MSATGFFFFAWLGYNSSAMFRILASLMRSPLRIRVLSYFFRRPDSENTVSDAAATLSFSRSSVAREIAALVRLGVLQQRTTRRVGHFRANMSLDFAQELSEFLKVTNPTPRETLAALRGIRSLSLLVISGALMNEDRSSIDILIVAKNASGSHIDRAIRKAEALVALPLRCVVFTPDEFKERREAHDRVIRDTFEFRHQILVDRRGK